MTDNTLNCFRRVFCATALLALSGCAVVQLPAPHNRNGGAESVAAKDFLGVRVLKTEDANNLNWSVELPTSCVGCRPEINRFTSGQNSKEFYFHLVAPSALERIHGLRVKVDPGKVRGVLVGRVHVSFNKTADGISFDVPRNGPRVGELSGYYTLPGYAEGDVTDFYTYLESPAIETRIEHADEQRRNGPYASGPWPSLERQAALNLEFAAREAIVTLGLNRTIQERGLGTILLMGFDTNYPTQGPDEAHDDDPPHWHMHMSWSREPIIREIGHFYIGPDGLLTKNGVGNMATHKGAHLERGQTHRTLTDSGETLYTQTITLDGYFALSTSKGICHLEPVAGGFQSGVELACDNGTARRRIRAEDDITQGRLRLFLDNRLVEEHFYDLDNGVLKRSEIAYESR
jgi:hypothetical protein